MAAWAYTSPSSLNAFAPEKPNLHRVCVDRHFFVIKLNNHLQCSKAIMMKEKEKNQSQLEGCLQTIVKKIQVLIVDP